MLPSCGSLALRGIQCFLQLVEKLSALNSSLLYLHELFSKNVSIFILTDFWSDDRRFRVPLTLIPAIVNANCPFEEN